MNTDINIEDGSIILSYSFMYDEDTVKKNHDKENDLPKIENLLSYTDRLFANNKIKKYMKQSVSLYCKETIYKLKIDDISILFFENKIAILYIKISSLDDCLDIEKLYNINKALTSFYTKKNDSYLYIGKGDPLLIKLPIEKFTTKVEEVKNRVKNNDQWNSDIMIEALKNEVPKNKIIFEDEYIKLKNIENKKEKETIIEVEIKKYNDFIKAFCEENYLLYTPHVGKFKKPYEKDEKAKRAKRAYPFSDEYKEFKGRVGFSLNEKSQIKEQNEELNKELNKEQNEEFNLDKIKYNPHYLYFEILQKLTEHKRKKDHIFEFIHYDTFITSLIMEYVKPNKDFQYYDTFNPRGTSYINSYITLTCDAEIINKEYENNFISFEPLISSKTVKGKNITNPEFFNIYQSQADIFTIGNSHNIVHIIDKDTSNMKANKEEHFYVYLLTCMQRSYILNIINSSIVNLNYLDKNNINPLKMKSAYKKLSDAINDYNNYLTNVNFTVISNNSSVDSSYNFFRECNEIDKLTNQWSNVSKRFNDWKSILSHVLSRYPVLSVLAVVIFGLAIKLANSGLNILSEYLSNFLKLFL